MYMAEMFLPKQNIFIIMLIITLVQDVFLGIFVRVSRERAARRRETGRLQLAFWIICTSSTDLKLTVNCITGYSNC